MRAINLLTHLSAFKEIKDDNTFKKYAIVETRYAKKKTRRDEEHVLMSFVEGLKTVTDRIEDFDHYYWNYTIPHFGQEFDLLRMDDQLVIDIELKSQASNEKVLKQLKKNAYYLNALGLKTECFSYVSSTHSLYHLVDQHLKAIPFEELYDYIVQQTSPDDESIDELMVPSQFLVSPFNHPTQFLDGEYFLTSHQDVIKKEILDHIQNKTASYFGITGDAGTGKTLLTYDLAKTLSQSYDVLIIHCADLNSGQQVLINKGMEIISVKKLRHVNLDHYDVIVIDEAQRLWRPQYDKIMDQSCYVIASYDPKQTLTLKDEASEAMTDYEKKCQIYKLTNTIRTNTEIMRFVANLFDLTKSSQPYMRYDNIDIVYFKDADELQSYIRYLKDHSQYIFLNFTASRYDQLKDDEQSNSQEVIGQEFDDVVVYLDESFYYDAQGKLCSHDLPGVHYRNVKMLYQNITRARHKLKLIIINNEPVFTKCVAIINRTIY